MPSINDNFADATEVTIATAGGTYTSPATNTSGNTTETGEPGGSSKNVSAWWKYTPTSSGSATFDTQLSTTTGSGTDTVMAIYTGTNFADMVQVASDDDGGGSATSRIAGLAVTSGTTYWIQVGGFGLQTMNVVTRVTGPETTGGGATDLTPADSAHAHASDSPTLTQAHVAAPADSTHGHTADVATLTQVHALAPADSTHTHAAESPTLTQVHILEPADSTHGHVADSPTLTTGTTLQPADSSHGSTSDTPALTQTHELAPADTGHAHTTDAPTVTQVHALAPVDSVHSHTADSPLVFIPSGLPPPAANTVVTPAEVRILTVAAETRIVTTPAETRIITD